MGKYIDKYKEIKGNKRLFALIKLGLWIVFFTIIFLVFSNPFREPKIITKKPVVEETELTNLLETKAYKFNYTINNNIYTGKFNENNLILDSEFGSFLVSSERILRTNENIILPDIKYAFLTNLYDLITSSYEESTTKYRDGSIEYTYINEAKEYNIIVKVKVVDKYITNVELNYLDTNIKIEYYDFNNLDFIIDESIYSYEYIKEGE